MYIVEVFSPVQVFKKFESESKMRTYVHAIYRSFPDAKVLVNNVEWRPW